MMTKLLIKASPKTSYIQHTICKGYAHTMHTTSTTATHIRTTSSCMYVYTEKQYLMYVRVCMYVCWYIALVILNFSQNLWKFNSLSETTYTVHNHNICMYVQSYIHTYIYTFVHVQTYIHTYIHTVVHTHIPQAVGNISAHVAQASAGR